LSATAGGAGLQAAVLKPDRDRGYPAVRAPLLQRPGPRLQHRDRDLSRGGPGAAYGIHALPVLRDGGAGGSRAAPRHLQLAAGEPIGHILSPLSVISIVGPACDEDALTMNHLFSDFF